MSTHTNKPGLMSLDDALAALTTAAAAHRVSATQTVSSFDALGRVLANDLVSPLDIPPADNTSMDGYAVRAADAQDATRALPVSQRIPAGRPPTPLRAGTAARIFTGAFIPEGADAVVMQEVCEAERAEQGDGVRILQAPKSGQWIRRRGEDVRCGDVVLTGGTLLTPQALGQAAGVGAAQLEVRRRVRVALMSTGDELVMPGTVAPADMPPGAIYNSNRYTLHGLLRAAGCEVSDLGIVPDDRAATERTLREAVATNDLIVSSGGVSVGEEDHIRPALAVVGRVQLWQLSIKPGKPLAFGAVRREGGSGGSGGSSSSISDEALFVGLPGNPVSSFVTFLLAALPVIRTLQGATRATPRAVPMRADFEWTRPDTKRREFIRVRRNDRGGLDAFANQSSGVLTSTVWADGLADLEPGQVVTPGDAIPFLPWAAFGL
jgi:molybdopterin molybdotransferase